MSYLQLNIMHNHQIQLILIKNSKINKLNIVTIKQKMVKIKYKVQL